MNIRTSKHISLLLLNIIAWLCLAGVSYAGTLHVPKDFPSIQSAVNSALPGDKIKVAPGTYAENVVVSTPDISLKGKHATLDGAGLLGIGIHVVGTSGIRIQGFVVQGFEVGIVLEESSQSRVHKNELRDNFSEVSTLRDGLQLIASHSNEVTQNILYENGHNGLTLKGGSTGNTLRGNVSNDNGLQVLANFGGCGIQLIGADNNDNLIAGNQTLRNGWGIQVGGGSNGNAVVQNSSHANDRSGVVVLDPGMDNFIGRNRAQGNGLADVAPSGTFDLFDQGNLDNTWKNNKGTFNH